MREIAFIASLALLLVNGVASAFEDRAFSAEVSAGRYFSSVDGGSYNNVDLFASHELTDDYGAFAYIYHDRDFTATYAGISRMLADLEIGLGVGRAKYSGQSWFVVHPWLYYAGERSSIYLYTEYIPSDEEDSFFYRFDVTYDIGDRIFAGLYAEKFFGVGPLVGLRLAERVEIQAAVPVLDRSDDTKMNAVVSISISF